MIASLPLAVALTAVFVLTGAYSLVRWSAAMTGPLPPGRRTAELAHLLMSVAMVVMTWTWAGTAGVTAQIVLFTVFALYFVTDALRRWRTGSHGCAGGSAHALMAAAMVWMLAAMPLIMPVPVAASAAGHGAHAGHGGGDAATDMGASTGPAGWAVVVTIGACAALLATSAFWAARSLRGRTVVAGATLVTAEVGADVPDTATDGAEAATGASAPAEPVAVGSGPTGSDSVGSGAAVLAAPAVVPGAASATGAHRLLGPRLDAGCHALMGVGMLTMLLAMVAGW